MSSTSTGNGQVAASQPSAIRAPGFVGREKEFAALRQALGTPPALVLIEGEAGIGKSRLVQEFVASAAPRQTLLAYCPPFRQPHTLGAVVDALRQAVEDGARGLGLSALAGALRPLFPDWAQHLPPTPEPMEDATASRHRVFCAIAELLQRLHIDVLIVEDLHWADETTLEFLLFLTTRQPAMGSLVATYRPEDVPADSLLRRLTSRPLTGTTYTRLRLDPFDIAVTTQLVSSMLEGQPVSDAFAAFVHQHTDGLPLAVEESMRLLSERTQLVHLNGQWQRRSLDELTVPPTIRDAVLDRVQRLDADTQLLLRAAAVIATPAAQRTLRQVTGLPASRVRNGITKALETRLLTEDSHVQFAFHHALASRAVYEAIPAPQRQELHRKAGRTLEMLGTAPAASLVRHVREAGDVAAWRRYGEQAADLALIAGDEGTAASLLSDLIVHGGLRAADIARLMSQIPLMWFTGHDRCRVLVAPLTSALDAGELKSSDEAELRCQLGRLLAVMHDWDSARRELTCAIPNLGHDPVSATWAMLVLGWPVGTDWPASEHLRWLRRAATLTDSTKMDEHLRVILHNNRVAALLLLGEESGWAEALRIPLDAPTARQRPSITLGNSNLAELAMLWGRYKEAERRLTIATDLAARNEYRHLSSVTSALRVHLDWLTGAWGQLSERSEALVKDDISLVPRFEAIVVTALLQATVGDHARSAQSLQWVLDEMRKHGATNYIMEPAAAVARICLSEGRVDDALEITDEPISIVIKKGIWLWATDLAPVRLEALLAAGRDTDATEFVASFGRRLRGLQAPAPQAALALCRAIIAQNRGDRQASRLFAQASAAWQALPRPYDALLARERQAQCLLAAGQQDEATAVLSAVLDGLTQLGATAAGDRVAHQLRKQGIAVPRVWHGGRRGYGDELSPKELEVVRLVSAGRTNREIANTLSRSVRTIEGQLASATRKLGVSTRAALAALAVESGLANGSQPAAMHSDRRGKAANIR